MWVRGLKHEPHRRGLQPPPVAPYEGAWIETNNDQRKAFEYQVAPYVGAWIETSDNLKSHSSACRTLCGCVD